MRQLTEIGPRATARLGAVLLIVLLTGCSPDADESASGYDDPVDGTLHVVLAGLQDGDGPAVCAHMYREAQVAFSSRYDEDNCIEAVAAAQEVISAEGSIPTIDSAEYEERDGVVTARGRPAARLAKLLGLPGLYLSEFEGDWTLQGSAQDPAIKERM
jgi:hypothetical protein